VAHKRLVELAAAAAGHRRDDEIIESASATIAATEEALQSFNVFASAEVMQRAVEEQALRKLSSALNTPADFHARKQSEEKEDTEGKTSTPETAFTAQELGRGAASQDNLVFEGQLDHIRKKEQV
jgi:hypothetical protein